MKISQESAMGVSVTVVADFGTTMLGNVCFKSHSVDLPLTLLSTLSRSLTSYPFGIMVKALPKCRAYHKVRRGDSYPKAQTGYNGFCKPCFRERFPAEYNAKQANRKKKSV